jgi:multiple sugar transport system ATP-binding protein
MAEPVNATVEVVELLGHELHLYLNSGKNSFVGTVDPRFGVHNGNNINLAFDMGNLHLFDKATQEAIR